MPVLILGKPDAKRLTSLLSPGSLQPGGLGSASSTAFRHEHSNEPQSVPSLFCFGSEINGTKDQSVSIPRTSSSEAADGGPHKKRTNDDEFSVPCPRGPSCPSSKEAPLVTWRS